jgi:hypothetical protein
LSTPWIAINHQLVKQTSDDCGATTRRHSPRKICDYTSLAKTLEDVLNFFILLVTKGASNQMW